MPLSRTLLAVATLAASATTLPAALYTYDGSILPSASVSPPYSYAVFPNTTWSTDGNTLTMTTFPGQGIWFGKHASHMPTPWSLGTPAEGNLFSIRTALADAASDGWHAYMYDGPYGASMEFSPTYVRFWTSTTPTGPSVSTDIPLDGTQYHDYGFFLKNGLVAYYIDGLPVVTGLATVGPNLQYLIIGDGSASSPGGTGSFLIDGFSLDTAPAGSPPTVPVPFPEPSCAFAALALLPLTRRRRA